jgi:hypothetical protein
MDVIKEIQQLITKAANAVDSIAALQFSQAAVNVANAMGSVKLTQKEFEKPVDKVKTT